MIRFIILIGYMGLMMYLQISGELNQYINIHYNYLAVLSMVLAFIMAIVQLILWNQADPSMQKNMKTCTNMGDRNIMAISIIWKIQPKRACLFTTFFTIDCWLIISDS